MDWREIRRNGEFLRYLPDIWQREQQMPAFFRASSFLWTKDFPSFVVWAVDMAEIWGLFDENGEFVACVYIEPQDVEYIAVVHFAVVKKIELAVLAAAFRRLRDRLFHRGIKSIRGWVLRRNFSFVRLMTMAGFDSSGLELKHGEHRGQVLKWDLMQVRAG